MVKAVDIMQMFLALINMQTSTSTNVRTAEPSLYQSFCNMLIQNIGTQSMA